MRVAASCVNSSATLKVVNNKVVDAGGYSVYPNPNNGSFACMFSADAECDLTLIVSDIAGKTVLTQAIHAAKGTNEIQETLPENIQRPGMYNVSLGDNSKKIYSGVKITVTR